MYVCMYVCMYVYIYIYIYIYWFYLYFFYKKNIFKRTESSRACYRHDACHSRACYHHDACYCRACRPKACYHHGPATPGPAVVTPAAPGPAIITPGPAIVTPAAPGPAIVTPAAPGPAIVMPSTPEPAHVMPASLCILTRPPALPWPSALPDPPLTHTLSQPLPPGLRLFRLQPNTLLDYLDFILFGRQVTPLEGEGEGGGKYKVYFVVLSCSCFHVFYSEVLSWFLFVSCYPFPHVFMLLVSLFNVSCFDWLSCSLCHVPIGCLSHVSCFSLVCSCHVTHSVCYK